MAENTDTKRLGWKVILTGVGLFLFAVFGMLVIVPFLTLTKGEKGRTGANELATPAANPGPTPAPAQAQTMEEGRHILIAAQAQLQRLHPSHRFELFKANYCSGNYAVVTFQIDGINSAAYLVKKHGGWTIVIEGLNPTAAEVKTQGFPASITQYPPPCFVEPWRG